MRELSFSDYGKTRADLFGITPELAAELLRYAAYSSHSQSHLFQTMISKDTEVKGAIGQRTLALQGGQWALVSSDGAKKRATSQLIKKLKSVRGWKRSIGHLGKFSLYGYSVVQIIFAEDGSGWPVELRPVPYASLDVRHGGKLFIHVDGTWHEVDKDPELQRRLIVLLVDPNDPAGEAILRPVAFTWLIKHFALLDWASYLERLGTPPIHASYDQGTVQADEGKTPDETILSRLEELRASANIVTPKTVELGLLKDDRGDASMAFDRLLERLDRYVKRAILTSESTMQSGVEGQGSRAADQVRAEAGLDTIVAADGELIAEVLQEQYVDRIAELQGVERGSVIVSVNWRKELSTSKAVDAITKLKSAGFWFDEDEALEGVGMVPTDTPPKSLQFQTAQAEKRAKQAAKNPNQNKKATAGGKGAGSSGPDAGAVESTPPRASAVEAS